MPLAFLNWLIICSFQVSLLSRVTFKNLVDDFISIMSSTGGGGGGGSGLDYVILLSEGGWVLITVDYGGGRGVKKCQKIDYVICERPLTPLVVGPKTRVFLNSS